MHFQYSQIFVLIFQILLNMPIKLKSTQIVGLKIALLSNENVMKQVNVCRKTVFNVQKRYQIQSTLCNLFPGRKH